MTEQQLQSLVDEGLTTYQIAERMSVSQTTVRYWLNKHSIRTRIGMYQDSRPDAPCYCGVCGTTDPSLFHPSLSTRCKKCHYAKTLAAGQDKRLRAVEAMGGKCERCGYDEHTCALDIHHLDPSLKDPSFKSMRGWAWIRIENELRHCALFCKNCHAVVHAGADPAFIVQ